MARECKYIMPCDYKSVVLLEYKYIVLRIYKSIVLCKCKYIVPYIYLNTLCSIRYGRRYFVFF